MKNLLNIFVSITLSLILLTTAGSMALQQQSVNAQNTEENKNYILVFGQRIMGNLDNSTNYVTAIAGKNLDLLKREFVEELSLTPSQQLQEQVDKIVNDGISGAQCEASLTTQEGKNVNVDCISSGNNVVWYIYPTK